MKICLNSKYTEQKKWGNMSIFGDMFMNFFSQSLQQQNIPKSIQETPTVFCWVEKHYQLADTNNRWHSTQPLPTNLDRILVGNHLNNYLKGFNHNWNVDDKTGNRSPLCQCLNFHHLNCLIGFTMCMLGYELWMLLADGEHPIISTKVLIKHHSAIMYDR